MAISIFSSSRPGRFCAAILLSSAIFGLVACGKTETTAVIPGQTTAVSINVDATDLSSKAFVNDNSHRVNRILIIPFRKTSEGLPDANTNFVPLYAMAKQYDVSAFPLNNAVIHLISGSTHKVLIVGYNSADYDFNNRNSPANRFDIGSAANPTTLDNFYLYPKGATAVPEFFTCICAVSNAGTPMGDTFKPENGYTLSGTLKRIASGLSVRVTNIPAFVKSVSLVAENLIKASKATDASSVLWQSTGDGGNRLFEKQVPVGGTVSFTKYLLPTFNARKTRLYLDIELGILTQRYTIIVPDGAVASDNRLIFNPNEAINITGNYNLINIGFTLTYGIQLDDNLWDGLN